MTVINVLDRLVSRIPIIGTTSGAGKGVVVERVLDAPFDAVARALADASGYAEWVVGAKEVRSWDETWPDPGSTFHHTQGAPYANIKDTSSVIERDGKRRLVLEVRARPLLVALTTFELEPVNSVATRVRMTETPTDGILRRLDNPALRIAVQLRNHETLRRLAAEANRSFVPSA